MNQEQQNRQLLFALLAFQNSFIERNEFISVIQTWVNDKTLEMSKLLNDRALLRNDEVDLLKALVGKHLRKHDDDAEKSITSLFFIDELKNVLRPVSDEILPSSASNVSHQPRLESSEETIGFDREQLLAAGVNSTASRRFRILKPHAQGGLGVVYLAHDAELGREVALKEIRPESAHDSNLRQRFIFEAEVTGSLEHPSIVPIYGLGRYDDGRPFYAMKFIQGVSLRHAIKEFHEGGDLDVTNGAPDARRIKLRQLLGRFLDACNAIDYAHDRGVLHRDIKPGNIMLGPHGETLVVDWGLAKATGGSFTEGSESPVLPASASSVAPTMMGKAIGTPAFMSPEQADGRLGEIDYRTDVYSLGATLYCIIAGRRPFNGPIDDVLSQVKRGDYAPPNSVATDVSHSLQAICQKAMNLLPDKRYQSVSEMTLDIERWLADEPVSAYQDTTVERLSRWIRKNLARVYAGTGIAAVSTVLAFGIVITNGAKRRAVDAEKFTSILESVISDEFGQFFHVESDTKEGDSLAAIAQKFPGDESQQLRMHVTFGNLMLDREDYDASAEHFRAAKELLPKSDVNPKYEWDAINGSAIVRWRRGEADAIAIVERLREMAAFDPDNSKLRRLDLLEANALKNSSDELELGDRLAAYEKASKLYQKYLTAESEPVDSSLFNLAQLHVERALAYRDAAKKRIASTLATEELEALAKEALTDGCEALQEMIRRIQERGAGNPTTLPKVWAEYAKTLHRLGDYAAADDAYNTACGMLSSELGDKHRIAIQTAYSWMVLLNQFMPAVDLPDKLERQKRGARFFVDNYIEGNGKPDSILTQNGIGLLARVAPDEFAKEFKQWVELDRKIKDGDFVAILSAVAP